MASNTISQTALSHNISRPGMGKFLCEIIIASSVNKNVGDSFAILSSIEYWTLVVAGEKVTNVNMS